MQKNWTFSNILQKKEIVTFLPISIIPRLIPIKFETLKPLVDTKQWDKTAKIKVLQQKGGGGQRERLDSKKVDALEQVGEGGQRAERLDSKKWML